MPETTDSEPARALAARLQRSRLRLRVEAAQDSPQPESTFPRSRTLRWLTDPRVVRAARVAGTIALFGKGRLARRLLLVSASVSIINRAVAHGDSAQPESGE